MKKTLLTASIFIGGLLSAQTIYKNPGGTISADAGNFTDTGGPGSLATERYAPNENIVTTICSATTDSCVKITFNAFQLDKGLTELKVYDGADTLSGFMGSYAWVSGPNAPVISSNGCLTFHFKSAATATVGSQGWEATITITSKCAKKVYNTGGPTNVLCFGKFYDTGGTTGTYKNNENSVTTFCPKVAGDSVRAKFLTFNLANDGDQLKIYNAADTLSGFIRSGKYVDNQAPVIAKRTTTNPSGCLTFNFISNATNTVTTYGWDADISVTNTVNCPVISVMELSALNNGFDMELVNPINNLLEGQLYARDNKTFTLEIIDIQGKVIKTEKITAYKGTNKISINASQLENGLYFVKLSDGDYSISKKIIKY